jgi:hypothetical protein
LVWGLAELMNRLSEEWLWNLFTAEVQRLDVDVIALQEVRLASNPTQRRRLGVAVPVLEPAAAGLEPGELGGLI